MSCHFWSLVFRLSPATWSGGRFSLSWKGEGREGEGRGGERKGRGEERRGRERWGEVGRGGEGEEIACRRQHSKLITAHHSMPFAA